MLLPVPFQAADWPKKQRSSVQALWDFHFALSQVSIDLDPEERIQLILEERSKITKGLPLELVSTDILQPLYQLCDQEKLPIHELASQVGSLTALQPGIRFDTAQDLSTWIKGWTGAHARLLARLAGMKGTWQLRYVDHLAEGFFLTGHLVTLPSDIQRGYLFIPQKELEKAIISEKNLASGVYNEDMKKLLWRQVVRARDTLAQGQPLVHEIPKKYTSAFKRGWLGALEVLNVLEKKGFNVFSEPVTLSRYHRLQVRFQARFGRTSFRKR